MLTDRVLQEVGYATTPRVDRDRMGTASRAVAAATAVMRLTAVTWATPYGGNMRRALPIFSRRQPLHGSVALTGHWTLLLRETEANPPTYQPGGCSL